MVGISGQIAAGKSTLTRGLAAHLGFRPVLENADNNPYLARYYREPTTFAFHNFMFFFEQSLTGQVRGRAGARGIVQERSLHEHLDVFAREFHARGFLSDDDIALFERLVGTALELVDPPALLVHLDVSPETAFQRLRKRGRVTEADLTLNYLEALRVRYDSFVAGWNASPLIRIETSEIDVRSAQGIAKVADMVLRWLPTSVA